MLDFASLLRQLAARCASLAYILENPAYRRVRESGGARDLYKLLNKRWLLDKKIGTVIDVGANEGQFLKAVVQLLPGVCIVACEPLPDVASRLQNGFAGHRSFHLEKVACGAIATKTTMHASKFAPSSSLLPLTQQHLKEFPNTETVGEVEIAVRPLDEVMAGYTQLPRPFLLKIDVQGYEKQVLLGARKTLSECAVVVCELNAMNLYEEQAPIDEILSELRAQGFELADIDGLIHSRDSDRLIYMDAAFIRKGTT